jgi:hypothetical protein
MSIIEESDGSADASVEYTNEFFDAAVYKIDSVFGNGYAKANPALIGALVQASSANLNAFMQAATAMPAGLMDMLPDELFAQPPKKGGKGHR